MANKETVLVTGGTGFVGLHIILQLLQKGYKVKTTLRTLKDKHKVTEALEANGIPSFEHLSFIEAELTKDDNWAEAMQGCKYVLSVASPVFFGKTKDEKEAIRPAVEGIIRVLKFARAAGVKRVVMTSNFGAVGFSQTDKSKVTTEDDWTDPNLKGLSVYEKSKTLAELAAWDFIKNEGGGLEFATINSVAIFGPSLNKHISGSLNMLTHLLDGSMNPVPPISLNLVDVRDVADLHIRAMENPKANGERFIATADGKISMPEIAQYLIKNRPEIAAKVSKKIIPQFLVRLLSLFTERGKEGVVFMNMSRNVSNAKARKILGWAPIGTNEQIIDDSLNSMIKQGIIK